MGIGISDLFNGGKGVHTVLTLADQLAKTPLTRTDKGYGFHLLAAERTDKMMQPFLFVAEKGKVKQGGLSHQGEEFVHVLEGEMYYRVGATRYRLGPGDSLYFDAEEEHDLQPISARVRYLAVFLERPEIREKSTKNSNELNKKKMS